MKQLNKVRGIGVACLAACAVLLASPAAAFTNLLFTGPGSGCSPNSTGNISGSRTCTSDGVTSVAKAYAFTGDPGNNVVQGAYLGLWGGGLGVQHRDSEGVESTSSPQHSLDNKDRFEMVWLDFGSKVVLDEVKIGWMENDSDITVLAYVSGTSDPSGKSISGGTLSGWSVVGHYDGDDIGQGNQSSAIRTIDINGGGTSSQFWLIGAYNPNFSGPAESGVDWDGYKVVDYLKLYAVSGHSPPGVPEPGSLALVSLAFGGLWRARRAKRS